MTASSNRSTLVYLLQESLLILLFAYLVVAGQDAGMIRYDLQAASFVLLTLLLGVWLAAGWRDGRRIRRSGLEWPILGLLSSYAVASALSTDPRRSLGQLALLALYALLFYLVADLLWRGWPVSLFVKCLLIASAIVSFMGLAEVLRWYISWLQTSGAGQLWPDVPFRLAGLLGHANTTADYLLLLIPLAIGSWIERPRPGPRILLSLWLVGAFVTLFFTSSRGGYLGLAAGLATLAVLVLAAKTAPLEWIKGLRSRPLALASLVILALSGGALVLALGMYQLQHPSHIGGFGARFPYWKVAVDAFRSSPIWGIGPGLYGTRFFQTYSVPPTTPFVHAHNYLLTVAGEAGIIGLGAVIWLASALALALWRAWRDSDQRQRLFLAAVSAALTGVAVHNLFDNLLGAPAVVVSAIVVVAAALHRPKGPHVAGPDVPWLALPAALLLAFNAWSLLAYTAHVRGLRPAQGERWSEAAPLLEEAARYDPAFAFYHLQSGFAWGTLAAQGGDDEALQKAIAGYEKGVALDASYSTNYANLAALYWQAGRTTEALEKMRRAQELAPQEATYPLNLGAYYEALGQGEEATANYRRALEINRGWTDAPYWQQTGPRRETLAGWLKDNPPPTPPQNPTGYADYLLAGQAALAANHFQEALEFFRSASDINPASIEANQGLGQAYQALGDTERADHYLEIANQLPADPLSRKLKPLLAWGDLAVQQGREDEALERYELAFSMVNRYSAFGPGTWGWSPYGWQMFYRESLVPDVLPQVIRLDITPEMAQRFLRLGKILEKRGETGKARAVYSRLLQSWPNCSQAKERLQGLGG